MSKTLHNSTVSSARKNVKDIVVYGNGDTFKLISKASSKEEGWMKSTKAMEIEGVGCVVQVTTQQGLGLIDELNDDIVESEHDQSGCITGTLSVAHQADNIAEALTFVPGVKIELIDGDKANGRKLVKM